MRIKCLIQLLVLQTLIYSLVAEPLKATSSQQTDQIKYLDRYPNTYTLFKLDLNRLSNIHKKSYPERCKGEDFYLLSDLYKEDVIWDDAEVKDSTQKKVISLKSDVSSIFILKSSKKKTPANELMDLAMASSSKNIEKEFIFKGSLLLYPQEGNIAFAYGFSTWKSVLNQKTIIPMWGLRVIGSKNMYSGQVKAIYSKSTRHSNRYTKREKKHKRTELKHFNLELGSEIISGIEASTKLSASCTGKDYFNFNMVKGPKEPSWDAINTHLRNIALGLDINTKELHPSFEPFIDKELTDQNLIKKLNSELITKIRQVKKLNSELITKNRQDSESIFMHEDVQELYGKSSTFQFKNSINKDLLALVTKREDVSLDTYITIVNKRKKKTFQETLSWLIFTAPIEYEKQFYRFDRMQWFAVDESRFEEISNVLNTRNIINYADLKLPLYGENTLERYYNENTVKYMQDKRVEAISFDRLNVSLGGDKVKNKFEFCDILNVENADEKDYINLIHVKRRTTGLSHLNVQVQRCAEYLGSNLDRTELKPHLKKLKLDNTLGSKGHLAEPTRDRVRITLAVIEDRKKKGNVLFKKQDLWALDRTRQVVERYGFHFGITIIPEEGHEVKDLNIFPKFTPRTIDQTSDVDEGAPQDYWDILRSTLKSWASANTQAALAEKLGLNTPSTLRKFLNKEIKKSPKIKGAYEANKDNLNL